METRNQGSPMESRRPLVSVITAVRNGARTLEVCIDSVRSQTMDSVEHIIIDDASTDATSAMLASRSDHGLTALRLPENRERAVARNVGIALARGEFIAFIDADDTWARDKLERQIKEFEADPGLNVLGTGYLKAESGSAVEVPTVDDIIREKLVFQCPLAFSSVLVRLPREHRDLLAFDPSCVPAEDFAIWQRLAHLQNRIRINFRSLSEPLMTYGFDPDRPGSESARHEAAAKSVRRSVVSALLRRDTRPAALDLAVGNTSTKHEDSIALRREAVSILRAASRRTADPSVRSALKKRMRDLRGVPLT